MVRNDKDERIGVYMSHEQFKELGEPIRTILSNKDRLRIVHEKGKPRDSAADKIDSNLKKCRELVTVEYSDFQPKFDLSVSAKQPAVVGGLKPIEPTKTIKISRYESLWYMHLFAVVNVRPNQNGQNSQNDRHVVESQDSEFKMSDELISVNGILKCTKDFEDIALKQDGPNIFSMTRSRLAEMKRKHFSELQLMVGLGEDASKNDGLSKRKSLEARYKPQQQNVDFVLLTHLAEARTFLLRRAVLREYLHMLDSAAGPLGLEAADEASRIAIKYSSPSIEFGSKFANEDLGVSWIPTEDELTREIREWSICKDFLSRKDPENAAGFEWELKSADPAQPKRILIVNQTQPQQ